MRNLPKAILMIGSLLVGTSCQSLAPVSPASSAQAFSVQAKPEPEFCPVSGNGSINVSGRRVRFKFDLAAFSPFEPGFGSIEVVDKDAGFDFVSGNVRFGVDCLVNIHIAGGDLAPGSTGFPGTWSLHVIDNGNPGKGNDEFTFTVDSSTLGEYSVTGTLASGNIRSGNI